jgi:uncharacterized protein YuzE
MTHLSLGPPIALRWSCNDMRLDHDPPADAVYIWLCDLPYAFGEDLDHARRIDYAIDRKQIGIELLNLSKGVNVDDLPEREAVEKLLESHRIRLWV